MPNFTVEMLWDCRGCPNGKRNAGLEKHCKNCGRPKDERCREYFADNVSIKDALDGDKRRRAQAGPDWKCKYCESLQSALNKCCTECGTPQGRDVKKSYKVDVETATFDPLSGAKLRSQTRTENVTPEPEPEPWRPEAATRPDRQSIRPVSSSEPFVGGYRDNAKSFPEFRTPFPWRIVVITACIAAVGLILWFIFRTKIVDVHVSAVSWNHAVKIERYQVWHREGWVADNGAFNIHDDGSRIHHYDHVLVGSHQEGYSDPQACGQDCTSPSCYTTPVSCSSNKNGTGNCSGGDRVCPSPVCTTRYCPHTSYRTVNDYEDQPRYQDWYDWNVWDWGYNRTVAHSGTALEESWPSDDELKPGPLAKGEQEREGGRFMAHKVVFKSAKGESWDIEPKDCGTFERYPVGASHRIKVGLAHGVEVLP